MQDNEDIATPVDVSLSEAKLNESEVEFSKVESTLNALTDGIDPTVAASWIDKA